MKLNRQLSIIMLLLTREVMVAPEFAQIFNITLRTIYRDIEEIKQAGIAIHTETGYFGGISIPAEFKRTRNITLSSDIVSVMISLINEYPKLLENRDYIISKHRNGALEENTIAKDMSNLTVIKVTVRFHQSYKNDLEKLYTLDIISHNKNGFYKAIMYIEDNEEAYGKFLLFGEKCECIEPKHVRECIKNKAEKLINIYK